jgi:hypothetical protein
MRPSLVVAQADWLTALRVYLLVLAGGTLVWEAAHLPLYTIWRSGTWCENAFAVVHCTGGDLLIAAGSLTLAFILGSVDGHREAITAAARWMEAA